MEILQNCQSYLSTQESHLFDECLAQLSELINSLIADEVARSELASLPEVWTILTDALRVYDEEHFTREQYRVLRGLVIVARTLVISCSERRLCLEFYTKILEIIQTKNADGLNKALNVAILQFLVNFTSSVDAVNVEDNADIKEIRYEYSFILLRELLQNLNSVTIDDEVLMFMYLNNLFNSTEFLYQFLNDQSCPKIVSWFAEIFNEAIRVDPPNQELLQFVMAAFRKLFVHESFVKFLKLAENNDISIVLTVAQYVLGAADQPLDNFQTTALLSWASLLFQDSSSQYQSRLENSDTNQKTFGFQTFKVLDIISSVIEVDHAREFLNHYKFLPNVCDLLKTLEVKFQRQDLKQDTKSDDQIAGFKTLIVEIITNLVHNNHDNQEYIRTSGTLEIILNNCQLDKNEPYIKERCIICIKFLLENNQENQEFVRKLQPEKVQINDETKLEQMGLELAIGKDGKINVHNKNSSKIKELR